MKKYVLILMAVMLLAATSAVYSADFESSTVPGLNMTTDIDAAFNASQSESKPVAIIFDQESCAYCDMLKEDVLSNADVQKEMNGNYVILMVDVNKNPDFAARYNVVGTPVIRFVDSNGKLIDGIDGYMESDEFIKELKEI